jgi:lysozyme family protein
LADFLKALPVILAHEGGEKYTVTLGDKGGATRWGITLATLRLWRGKPTSTTDVRDLTCEEAEKIYRARYWDICRCEEILDQDVATKIFDVSVNCGTWSAIRMAQRAAVVPVDGVMGPQTITAINGMDGVLFVDSVSAQQRNHYQRIVEKDPSQAKFLAGWLNRADWPKGST